MTIQTTIICIAIVGIFGIALLFGFFKATNKKRRKHYPSVSYISPPNKDGRTGWKRLRKPPNWVKHTLETAPDYQPEMGHHYFPYIKGRHFEYYFDGYTSNIYRRRLYRH
jgi:hypothetical protein